VSIFYTWRRKLQGANQVVIVYLDDMAVVGVLLSGTEAWTMLAGWPQLKLFDGFITAQASNSMFLCCIGMAPA